MFFVCFCCWYTPGSTNIAGRTVHHFEWYQGKNGNISVPCVPECNVYVLVGPVCLFLLSLAGLEVNGRF